MNKNNTAQIEEGRELMKKGDKKLKGRVKQSHLMLILAVIRYILFWNILEQR